MKKLIYSAAAVLMAAVIVCGCTGCIDNNSSNGGENNDTINTGSITDTNSQQQEQLENSDDTVDPDAYKKPADTVNIDMTSDDPSNDDIRFVIEEGKVTQCYYNIGGQEVFASYKYNDDGTVEIYAFMGEFLVADDVVEIPAELSDESFMEIDGYYFKTEGLKN